MLCSGLLLLENIRATRFIGGEISQTLRSFIYSLSFVASKFIRRHERTFKATKVKLQRVGKEKINLLGYSKVYKDGKIVEITFIGQGLD